jgi:hypothetical protein
VDDLQYVGGMTHGGAFVLGALFGVVIVFRVFAWIERRDK